MNKKRIIIMMAALALIIGGSVYAAVEIQVPQPLNESTITPQKEIELAPLEDQSHKSRVSILEIKDDINIPLDMDGIPQKIVNGVITSGENRISKLIDIQANKYEYGDNVVAIYQLEDGYHEIIFSQSRNTFENELEAVEDTKSWYDAHDVRDQKINGHSAVIEDSVNRKQVHLITDSHFYTVASPGTTNLDYLIELAGAIKQNTHD